MTVLQATKSSFVTTGHLSNSLSPGGLFPLGTTSSGRREQLRVPRVPVDIYSGWLESAAGPGQGARRQELL